MPALVAISFKNKPGIICSGQNLILEAKICHWKVLEQGNLNEIAEKENVGHILSDSLKWCQMLGNGQTSISENDLHYMLEYFFAKFFRYPLPLSEVIYSFLFLRNTFQFLGRHSISAMFEGSPTIGKREKHGKTMQDKCFERKSLKCPQSLRECCAIKTACTFLYKSCENADFQVNFGFGLWWLHFFPSEMFTGAITFKHYLSSWISNP